jgi:hypothetical protein
MLKDQLTNQNLSDKYPNSFELVNYAIALAKNMIEVERECVVPVDGIINSSYQILEEICQGEDRMHEPKPKAEYTPEESTTESKVEEKKPKRKLLKTLRTTRPSNDSA